MTVKENKKRIVYIITRYETRGMLFLKHESSYNFFKYFTFLTIQNFETCHVQMKRLVICNHFVFCTTLYFFLTLGEYKKAILVKEIMSSQGNEN